MASQLESHNSKHHSKFSTYDDAGAHPHHIGSSSTSTGTYNQGMNFKYSSKVNASQQPPQQIKVANN